MKIDEWIEQLFIIIFLILGGFQVVSWVNRVALDLPVIHTLTTSSPSGRQQPEGSSPPFLSTT